MEQESLDKVKKLLYKKKPVASFVYATKNGLVYVTDLVEEKLTIVFVVPLNDLGDAAFRKEETSQLLIRYISTISPIVDN